jgi:hypothetical protein
MIGVLTFEITEEDIYRRRHSCLSSAFGASDRGRGADCKPLHMKGSRGALFKVRLSSHGYILVAKGMEKV